MTAAKRVFCRVHFQKCAGVFTMCAKLKRRLRRFPRWKYVRKTTRRERERQRKCIPNADESKVHLGSVKIWSDVVNLRRSRRFLRFDDRVWIRQKFTCIFARRVPKCNSSARIFESGHTVRAWNTDNSDEGRETVWLCLEQVPRSFFLFSFAFSFSWQMPHETS